MNEATQKEKLVVGLGSTGMSCARYLSAMGERFRITDTRSDPPGLGEIKESFPKTELELGQFNLQSFLDAEELIVSPGVPLSTPEIQEAKASGVPITGDIDIFSKNAVAPIIAVTGSNGKSTVVEILAAILQKAGKNFGLGGNLDSKHSKPALDLLLEDKKDIYLLELSSFQLETTSCLGAEVACILNISEDHLDRYDSIEQYAAAKQKIYCGASTIVMNRDDSKTYPLDPTSAPIWDFGFSRPGVRGFGLLEEDGDQYLAFQFEKIISADELKVFGQHNIANVLAATAIATTLGIKIDAIRNGIRDFSGLPHRCQWVGEVGGVGFYNDSKGTNVGATVAAVEGLGQRITGHIVLIAGGVSKGADFTTLVPVINRWGKEVILIGQDAVELAANLDTDIQTYFAEDMQDAVKVALDHASPGDAVLLSPACASFDMFDNYQHRGLSFIQSVESLQ